MSSQFAAGPSRGKKRAAPPVPMPLEDRFISDKYYNIYKANYQTCKVIVERPLHKTNVSPKFRELLQDRGWGALMFVPSLDKANETLAREFCANMNDDDVASDIVRVRGKNVDFSEEVINEYHGFADIRRKDDYVRTLEKLEEEGTNWLKQVRDEICPGADWVLSTTNKISGLKYADVGDENVRVAFRFIHNRLAPKDFPSALSIEDLSLYYALQNAIPIDLGRLQFEQLKIHTSRRDRVVILPHLIRTLCLKKEVEEYDEDTRSGKIVYIQRKGKPQPPRTPAPQPAAAPLQISAEHREALRCNDSLRTFIQKQRNDIGVMIRSIHEKEIIEDRSIFEPSDTRYLFPKDIELRMGLLEIIFSS